MIELPKRKHQINDHHIIFTRKNFADGYAYKLRHAFVRPVPVPIHDELHHDYLSDVPRPPEDVMKKAWSEYCANKAEIDQYDLCRAIAWLYVHVEDAQFRKAMQIQLDFFTIKLGPE